MESSTQTAAERPGQAAAASPPAIELSHVSQAFGQQNAVRVLDDISLSVGKSEFVAIVGPSGCGKSTILNIVSGLLAPTSGAVRIDGRPVRDVQSEIGYMLSTDALLPWSTAEQNVALSLRVQNHRRRIDMAPVTRILRDIGLAGFERHYPGALSSGMRQRVALARTFVRSSSILLMDEPFSALDAQVRLKMQDLFLSLRETRNQAVLFITHDVAEAVALSDRVIVLTHRPTTVHNIYSIDLPRPRSAQRLMLEEPLFQTYMRDIWRDLEGVSDHVD